MTPSRPVLRYHGGKFRAARIIVPLMPPHAAYCEPFAGAASVFFAKPRCEREIINDLDEEIVNVFRVLRDPARAGRLEDLLRLTPFARAEFEGSYRPARSAIERARRTIVRSFMGFGSAAVNPRHITGFRGYRSDAPPSQEWANYADALPSFVARLRGVTVERRPAIEVIRAQDGPGVLFYADPPYLHATRTAKRWQADRGYAHEMTDADHCALAQVLHQVQGMVLLSGYESLLYDSLYKGWNRVEYTSHADGARKRTECLWFNPAAWEARPQTTLEFAMEEHGV